MALADSEVADLPGLLGAALEVRDQVGEGATLWFRGAQCGQHPLVPKLLREDKEPEEYFDRESRLITRFRQRSLSLWPAGYPQNDWEHLFAMQHFGVPTRLLDWSENLFVAAFFALQSVSAHDWHDGDCQPTVWCIDPRRWNGKTPVLADYGDPGQVLTTADAELESYAPDTQRKRMSTPVAVFGAHNSDRIVAQRGNFMVWGKDPRPLEQFSGELDHDEPNLWKFVLTGDSASLALDLMHIGFLETFVYPDLPSMASEITRTVEW